MRAVVEPDADDLLRVRHRRQELDLGKRRAVPVLDPGGRGETVRSEQVPYARALAPERVPDIDDAVFAQQAGPGAPTREIADEPHRG
jgi:hypothetical protein